MTLRDAKLEHELNVKELRLGQVTRAKYVRINRNFRFSVELRKHLNAVLDQALGKPKSTDPTIVVCGSVARLEASGESDLDFMIIYPGTVPSNAGQFRDHVYQALKTANLQHDGMNWTFKEPNKKGVFADDVSGPLLYKGIGTKNEDYNTVSQRMLLVLESTALWNPIYHDNLLNKIMKVYQESVYTDASKHFVLLLNDLIRYFRLICVNYHALSKDDEEFGKWPVRNLKLRHSRVVMYISLLLVLGELSKLKYAKITGKDSGREKVEALRKFVDLPPLERIIRVYEMNQDTNLYRFLGLYNVFLEALSHEEERKELKGLEYDERYKSRTFASLKTNSDSFAAEITRFVFARRGAWSDRFYEYMLL